MNYSGPQIEVQEQTHVICAQVLPKFCRSGNSGFYPVFANRRFSGSQKWTITIFRRPDSPAVVLDLWVGQATIPEIKKMIIEALAKRGFMAITGLTAGGDEISCFVLVMPPTFKALNSAPAFSGQSLNIMHNGLRLHASGHQSISPALVMIKMLVDQYALSEPDKFSYTREALPLTGPECMKLLSPGLWTW